jgi:hypothetical protein
MALTVRTREQREREGEHESERERERSKPAGVALLQHRHHSLLDSPLDGTHELVIDACTSLLMV